MYFLRKVEVCLCCTNSCGKLKPSGLFLDFVLLFRNNVVHLHLKSRFCIYLSFNHVTYKNGVNPHNMCICLLAYTLVLQMTFGHTKTSLVYWCCCKTFCGKLNQGHFLEFVVSLMHLVSEKTFRICLIFGRVQYGNCVGAHNRYGWVCRPVKPGYKLTFASSD